MVLAGIWIETHYPKPSFLELQFEVATQPEPQTGGNISMLVLA